MVFRLAWLVEELPISLSISKNITFKVHISHPRRREKSRRGTHECVRHEAHLICWQVRDLNHRADFNCAPACRWNACGNADRLVEVLRVDQEVAAELFARFRERTVGHELSAVAHPDASR